MNEQKALIRRCSICIFNKRGFSWDDINLKDVNSCEGRGIGEKRSAGIMKLYIEYIRVCTQIIKD